MSLKKSSKFWNSPDGGAYFTDLLQSDGRSGGRMDREGFPEKVWQETFNWPNSTGSLVANREGKLPACI